jgi:uncharacterized protein DUF2183
MTRVYKIVFLLLILGAVLGIWYFMAAREEITFYDTYGYKDGDEWVIPIHLRVWERGIVQRALDRSIAHVVSDAERFTGREINSIDEARVRVRLAAFTADDERRQRVTLEFDDDPNGRRYPVRDAGSAEILSSNSNGRIDGQLRISVVAANDLLQRQRSRNSVLTYHAVSRGHTGKGKVRLIPDTRGSLSVISDIDDTIKITEVPAGHRVLFLNTFVREFRSAPGMADRYKQWTDAAFHYVSGGPWQLYQPLFEFLPEQGFPAGSVHMRNLPLHITNQTNAQQFIDFLFNKQATAVHKKRAIREIMTHFPNRTFIFVGDSGECDPEVYREIKDDPRFGERVQAIFIRVVTDSKEGRLDGMQVIDATKLPQAVAGEPACAH